MHCNREGKQQQWLASSKVTHLKFCAQRLAFWWNIWGDIYFSSPGLALRASIRVWKSFHKSTSLSTWRHAWELMQLESIVFSSGNWRKQTKHKTYVSDTVIHNKTLSKINVHIQLEAQVQIQEGELGWTAPSPPPPPPDTPEKWR